MRRGAGLGQTLLAGASSAALLATSVGGSAADVPQRAVVASVHLAASTQPSDEHARPAAPRRPAIDLFAPRSWAPPPPPAPPARSEVVHAPPPAAPPLPFVYLGQLREGGRTLVFLSRGEEPIAVAAGEVLDGTYRIERVDDTSVEFVYLPLHERQVLGIGGMRP